MIDELTPCEHCGRPMGDFVAETYLRNIAEIRRLAKSHGYAIATHGSLSRDIDLVAIPWVEEASSPEVLAEALRVAVNGHFSHSLAGQHLFANKPHGRLGCCINVGNGVYFDLAIMPLVPCSRSDNLCPK